MKVTAAQKKQLALIDKAILNGESCDLSQHLLFTTLGASAYLESSAYAGMIVRDGLGRASQIEMVGPVCGNVRVVCLSTNHRYEIMDWNLDTDCNMWDSADVRMNYTAAVQSFREHVAGLEDRWGAHEVKKDEVPNSDSHMVIERDVRQPSHRDDLIQWIASSHLTDEQLAGLSDVVAHFVARNKGAHWTRPVDISEEEWNSIPF
jgi:hypothetical protein